MNPEIDFNDPVSDAELAKSSSTSVHQVDRANLDRLIARFAELSEEGPGVTRLAYTHFEREAHRVFGEEMVAMGLTVSVDAAGNSVAELSATRSTGGAGLGTGSHLDSVPSGGRFDGIAGVCAAIEAARVVIASDSVRRRPWRFVAFAAEEGARFGQACTGSRVVAGLTGPSDLDQFSDKDGTTMAQAMREVGLEPGSVAEGRWEHDDWFAFIELHIEQGNVLESHGIAIGVVDAISGSSRLLVELSGVASHTGGTPMRLRRDALTAAAECVIFCESLANDEEHHGTRITVGRLEVDPGSITTIPGHVTFTVDVRDFDHQRQRDTARKLVQAFEATGDRRGVGVRIDVIGDTSPVVLPISLVNVIARSSTECGLPYRILASGASHDAQQINRVTPTGMIFVPSLNGLSHVPEEFTSSEELALGTEVLVAALLALDGSDSLAATKATE